MNGEKFYQEFKEALTYLGVSWAEKDKVEVTNTLGGYRMDAPEGRSVFIRLTCLEHSWRELRGQGDIYWKCDMCGEIK